MRRAPGEFSHTCQYDKIVSCRSQTSKARNAWFRSLYWAFRLWGIRPFLTRGPFHQKRAPPRIAVRRLSIKNLSLCLPFNSSGACQPRQASQDSRALGNHRPLSGVYRGPEFIATACATVFATIRRWHLLNRLYHSGLAGMLFTFKTGPWECVYIDNRTGKKEGHLRKDDLRLEN